MSQCHRFHNVAAHMRSISSLFTSTQNVTKCKVSTQSHKKDWKENFLHTLLTILGCDTLLNNINYIQYQPNYNFKSKTNLLTTVIH